MTTRTTGKRETLEERVVARQKKSCKWDGFIEGHIRAEYSLLISRLAAKKRGKLGENAIWDHGYRKALTDVLAIVKELKKRRSRIIGRC